MLRYLRVWAPLAVAAAGVPLAADAVPPNSIYGFRTPKTKASSEIWYRANHIAGFALIAAGCTTLALNILISRKLGRRWNKQQLSLAYTGTLLAPFAIATLVSFTVSLD